MEHKYWKWLNIVLLVCAGACLVCYDMFGGLWLKGFTSFWFVLLGGVNLWVAGNQGSVPFRFPVLIFAGLLCGMCADVLLQIEFLAGAGVFALGHILYFIAFCSLEAFRLRDLRIILPVTLVSVFLVTGTPWITVEDPFLRMLVPGYAVIIAVMLGKALANLSRRPNRFRLLLLIGSAMFWFSDLALAVDIFGQSSRLTWILCSYCYWPAQNLLAHSLFYTNDDCRC